MGVWRLVDGRDPVDHPDDFPVKTIASEAELRTELDRLGRLDPGIVILQSPSGQSLQVGIGGSFVGLRWYQNPETSEQSRDLLADEVCCSERVDFRAEGDSIAFWPEHLMPLDEGIDIAVYFYHHLRLPEWVAWKEWDPARYKWNIKSAVKVRSA